MVISITMQSPQSAESRRTTPPPTSILRNPRLGTSIVWAKISPNALLFKRIDHPQHLTRNSDRWLPNSRSQCSPTSMSYTRTLAPPSTMREFCGEMKETRPLLTCLHIHLSTKWDNLAQEFEARFGRKPAYIARAPGRVKYVPPRFPRDESKLMPLKSDR